MRKDFGGLGRFIMIHFMWEGRDPLMPGRKTVVGRYMGGYSLFCQFNFGDCQVQFDFINL